MIDDSDRAEILHLAADSDWADRSSSHYQPAAFEAEGFVHCCTPAQLPGVVSRYYEGRSDVVMLLLDESKLDAPLVWEDTSGSGDEFPHVYGPIALEAVLSCLPFDPGV